MGRDPKVGRHAFLSGLLGVGGVGDGSKNTSTSLTEPSVFFLLSSKHRFNSSSPINIGHLSGTYL